jgi:hypothetical protein
MKKIPSIIIVMFILFIFTSNVYSFNILDVPKKYDLFSDPSKKDIILEGTYQLLNLIDWHQSQIIAKRPNEYYEVNPFIGKHPSVGQVNTYFAISSLGHIGISYLLPRSHRNYFQYGTIVMKAGLVAYNKSAGLGLGFAF